MAAAQASTGERNAGLMLIVAAAAALLVANSPWADGYQSLLHARLGALTIHYWIADVLMALFFLLIGLEVKREWYDGRLSTPAQRRLPMLAAASGMAVPAAIFLLVAGGEQELVRGWAIPAATDIAFALGVLGLLGSRAPPSLKLLLVTIAIVDDIGAVIIIALFYTAGLDGTAVAAIVAIFVLMAGLNLFGVRALWPYLLAFPALWLAVFASGIHPTIAGVLAALTIPLGRGEATSPLKRLEHRLHPWVMFGVVPLFGLASAGVSLSGASFSTLPLAVALGLVVGKQAGVFGAIWLADRTGIAPRPDSLTWRQLHGAALLCGIGFTMSLFIGALAFPDPALAEEAKIGTLAGSVLAGLLGFLVLRTAPPLPSSEEDRDEAAEIFGEDADEDPTVCKDPYSR
jgi:NhaA family Na+:H+ antiporter